MRLLNWEYILLNLNQTISDDGINIYDVGISLEHLIDGLFTFSSGTHKTGDINWTVNN